MDIITTTSLPKDGRKKVLILLHGVTGSSRDKYMMDTAGDAHKNGMNVVCFNHYAPEGEKDLRLMNMCKNDFLDEVISYTKNRFEDNEIYLCGYSLGGNHILRYMGSTAFRGEDSISKDVSGIIAVGCPFDVEQTCLKL